MIHCEIPGIKACYRNHGDHTPATLCLLMAIEGKIDVDCLHNLTKVVLVE